VSSLPIVTVEASTGGEESYTFHPWSTWDVLGKHVKVVAHAIGGVCYSSGVDALPSPRLNPLEGPTMLSCGKLGLEGRSRLLALKGGRGACWKSRD
jgi:hypothetical protein